MALVSGTSSSGPLREEPYEGSRLLEQLRDQTSAFLMDERFNQIGTHKRKMILSPLFKELAHDFVLGYGQAIRDTKFSPEEMALVGFIRIHVSEGSIKDWISKRKYKIQYLLPDTSLNDTGFTH